MAGLILWVMNMIYQERYVYYIIVIRNVPNVSSTIPATDFGVSFS